MPRVLWSSILFFALTLVASDAHADDASRAELRAEFQRAFTNVNTATATTDTEPPDSNALRNYVLYPYLQQARIVHALQATGVESNNVSDLSGADRDAASFLNEHAGEPVTHDLRRLWYASLAKRHQWQLYLDNYRDVDDPGLRCYELDAQLALQRLDNLATRVAAVWATTSDSLQACEPVFTWLKTQSLWTPALIERRARAALSANSPAFARQLIALLPKENAEPLETWAALIERPLQSIDAAIAAPSKKIEPESLLDGWIRLARSDPDAAMHRYAKLVRARALSPQVASRYALELALVLSWNRKSEALRYFEKVRTEDFDERASEWYGRAAIWSGDWRRVVQVVNAMPTSLRQQTRWQYWHARANELLGHKEDAKKQYAALLNDDNYYAALAAARIHRKYLPHPQAMPMDTAQINALSVQPPFDRAHELLSVKLLSMDLRAAAYGEWRYGYRKLSTQARVQAVVLASQWGWYDQMILTSAEQKLFDDYPRLYPTPFDTQVKDAAKLTQLPIAVIYATLRQESLYRTDALSGANAQGLMQLQIATAKRTARKWQLPPPGDLFDPSINIPLGSAYLRDLRDRFGGNIALALAAYNAGPGAPPRWMTHDAKDADVWIENIPYNETRLYVQRVLWHSIVFGWIADGAAQDASGWLTPIKK